MPSPELVHQYWFSSPISWTRLLIQNKGVSIRYIPKAIIISILSIVSYPFQLLNSLIINIKSRGLTNTEDPVFIIGHWRGGTTYLHYLLSQDDNFGFLTYYHAFIPNLAIIGGNFLKYILSGLVPTKRPQDNIKIAMDLPTEEENPLSTFSNYSASHSFFFPHNESYYNKYSLFQGTSSDEKRKWQNAYRKMLRRISIHQKGKQLLIKNPHNTGRIKELIEIFPKAKFIHIYRNPYEVYPSTFRMYDMVIRTQFLQDFSTSEIEQKIIYYYNSLMKRYFEVKDLIPKDQLIEIRFEEFEKDPMAGLMSIYKNLNLTIDDKALSKMNDLINSEKEYIKNKHVIPVHIRNQIEKEWAFGFRELGYSNEDHQDSK